DHPAAECLRHELMAEADADHRAASARAAHEVFQPIDPAVAVVNTGRRAGDDIRGATFGLRGQLAIAHFERSELVLRTQQLLHHRAVGAESLLQRRRRITCLQNADLDRHGGQDTPLSAAVAPATCCAVAATAASSAVPFARAAARSACERACDTQPRSLRISARLL